MKKNTKILLSVLIFLGFILCGICFEKVVKFEKIKISSVDKINYLTVYKDFSEIKGLSSEYSYSSITLNQNTDIVLLNTDFQYIQNETDFANASNPGGYSTKDYIPVVDKNNNIIDSLEYLKVKYIANNKEQGKNFEVKYLITNCARDKDNNPLDIIVTFSEFKSFYNNKTTSMNFYFGKNFSEETDQMNPKCAVVHGQKVNKNSLGQIVSVVKDDGSSYQNANTTQVVQRLQYGSPLPFFLSASGVQVKFSMTYYKHPDNNAYKVEGKSNVTNSKGLKNVLQLRLNSSNPLLYGKYVMNINDSFKKEDGTINYGEINLVNGFFYDIDVTNNQQSTGLNTTDSFIFNGTNSSNERRNEGFAPVDRLKNKTTIYYNKNRKDQSIIRWNQSDVDNNYGKKVNLAEDNGGLRIASLSAEESQFGQVRTLPRFGSNNKYGGEKDVDGNYAINIGGYNIDSAWYGQSAFMTNQITNSTLEFCYCGDGCGMQYMFMSPSAYTIPNPKKTIQKKDVNGNVKEYERTTIKKNEMVNYHIKQYMPSLYYTHKLHFEQLYGSLLDYSTLLDVFEISDDLDSYLQYNINDIIIKNDESEDITNLFTLTKVNNKLKITLKDDYKEDIKMYNTTYDIEIPVKLKNQNIYKNEITNKAKTIIKHKNITKVYEKETNTVYLNIVYDILGNVWIENGIVNGRKDGTDINAKGVLVVLYNINNSKIDKITRTDSNGNYTFKDLPSDQTYKILFYYNEQLFQSTYYKNSLSGGFSVGKEIESELLAFQEKFASINSHPNNYGQGKIAWGINQIIKDVDTNKAYIYNGYPLIFDKILYEFDNVEINNPTLENNNYDSTFYSKLKSTIKSKYGISENTANALIEYLKDCIMRSMTNVISINDMGFDGKNNHIDFGMYLRPITDIAVENNINSIYYSINGVNYMLSAKRIMPETNYVYKTGDADSGYKRDKSGKYNSDEEEIVEVTSADYLYNALDYGESENKNLQMRVNYEYRIKNSGNSYVRVNDLNILYDQITYKPESIAKIYDNNNQEIGQAYLVETNEGIKGYKKLKITNLNCEIASREEIKIIATYQVKKNRLENGKERLIVEGILGKEQGKNTNGKKNIIELANYQTFYKKGKMDIPDYLDENNNPVDKNYTDKMSLGTIDINSNPGNLNEIDLRDDGRLYYEEFTIENDVDQALSIKVMLTESTKIKGTVFEDTRVNKLENGAVIGNGTIDNEDLRINGVTVELVELLVNPITGEYEGEKVWKSYKYDENLNSEESNEEYYSGKGKSKIIINGKGALETKETNLNKGEYMFDGVPTGKYVVRFKYGDTIRTVLDNTANEVNTLLNLKGMNSKSYNGQDYKSTIYQSTTEKVNGTQYGINNNYYNGTQVNEDFYNNKNFINGYNDYQQYTANKNEYVKNSLSKLYYYDNEHISENDSDAKDIYYYRLRSDDYSKNLINKNSEVLNSYRQLVQAKSDEDIVQKQKNEINELVNNTSMVAQTGVMSVSLNQKDMNNINLGLQERPKSQIILNHEVSNVKVLLANGRVEFDASQSLKNLYYGQHKECGYSYRNNQLVQPTLTGNSKQTPELIQVYMDNEIMDGSQLVATYKIKAKNIGEVDYKDKLFYYTGVENNPNDNLAKVKINKIINYTSNNMKYDENTNVNKDNSWKVKNTDELYVENGKEKALVNAVYKDTLKTYDTLLITEKGENKYLQPVLTTSDAENSELEIELELNTSMGTSLFQKGNLTYNNLTELVEVTSENGRKLNYSVLGNQDMADQSLGANSKPELYTNYDLVTPKEVDADSSQKINILPPTGENKNYLPIVISVIISSILVIIAAIIIKKKVIDK